MMKEISQEHTGRIKRKIREGYKDILGEGVDITVVVVDKVPTTGTAKRRVVISKLPTINGQNPDLS